MNNLPYEIILEIISLLDSNDCINLSQTNITMRSLCLGYLTKNNGDVHTNHMFQKMRKNNFYDYYIIKNKDNHYIDVMFYMYDIKSILVRYNR